MSSSRYSVSSRSVQKPLPANSAAHPQRASVPSRVVWTPRPTASASGPAVTSSQNGFAPSNGYARRSISSYPSPEALTFNGCATSHYNKAELSGTEVSALSGKGSPSCSTSTVLPNKNGVVSKSAHYPNGFSETGSYIMSPRSHGGRQVIYRNGDVIPEVPQLRALETTDVDSVLTDELDHPFFALTDNSSRQDDLQIVSSKGTVRGVRNRVKAGIAIFADHQAGVKHKVSLNNISLIAIDICSLACLVDLNQ